MRDLNRGSYGFVVLAYDEEEKREVAVKFMERGEQVRAPIAMVLDLNE